MGGNRESKFPEGKQKSKGSIQGLRSTLETIKYQFSLLPCHQVM